ncbi:hypothetical protein SO802_031963 [Lithocarpus litseifolius]|uniref:Uncharacterized protein n=1 Tax=Lithocarpus litseifolius TaxID=425828 RepID=A0AAW2BMK9_9ROSI
MILQISMSLNLSSRVPITNPSSQCTSGEATPFQYSVKEEEEEKEKQKEPLSPEVSASILEDREESVLCAKEMGLQRKARSTLQVLFESQPGRDGPGKMAQSKPPAPPTIPPFCADPPEHKRKREDRGKEVMEVGRQHPPQEIEVPRGGKQPWTQQTRSANEMERRGDYSGKKCPRNADQASRGGGERERKSAVAALDSAERQAEGQRVLLCNAEDQLASSKQQIVTLQKKLEEVQKAKELAEKAKEEVEKARDEAEQQGSYCSQVWIDAFNQVGVGASSILRKAENMYYPPAIRVAPSGSHLRVAEQLGVKEKETEGNKEVVSDTIFPLAAPQDPAKVKEAPRMEIVLASLPLPPKGDSKSSDQGSIETAAQQSKAPLTGKIVIKKK